jgi:hypothetical protein
MVTGMGETLQIPITRKMARNIGETIDCDIWEMGITDFRKCSACNLSRLNFERQTISGPQKLGAHAGGIAPILKHGSEQFDA